MPTFAEQLASGNLANISKNQFVIDQTGYQGLFGGGKFQAWKDQSQFAGRNFTNEYNALSSAEQSAFAPLQADRLKQTLLDQSSRLNQIRAEIGSRLPDASSTVIRTMAEKQLKIEGLSPEQLSQYNAAKRYNRWDESGGDAPLDKTSLLKQFTSQNTQATAQAEKEIFFGSISSIIDAFKADPTNLQKYKAIEAALKNAPVNVIDSNGTSDVVDKNAPKEFNAFTSAGQFDPELAQLLGSSQRIFDPGEQKDPIDFRIAKLIPGAVLAASFLPTAFGGTTAGTTAATGTTAAGAGGYADAVAATLAANPGAASFPAMAGNVATGATGGGFTFGGGVTPATIPPPITTPPPIQATPNAPTPPIEPPIRATPNAPTPPIEPPPNLPPPTPPPPPVPLVPHPTLPPIPIIPPAPSPPPPTLQPPNLPPPPANLPTPPPPPATPPLIDLAGKIIPPLIGGVIGGANAVDAPTLMEPRRIPRTPIEDAILAVTQPRAQRNIDLMAQERAAKAGATGGTTSGEIFRDQLQRQLGTESLSQDALNAMLSSYNLQGQQQGIENAFANQTNAARLKQLTATTGAQDRNLSNIFAGVTTGAQLWDIFNKDNAITDQLGKAWSAFG